VKKSSGLGKKVPIELCNSTNLTLVEEINPDITQNKLKRSVKIEDIKDHYSDMEEDYLLEEGQKTPIYRRRSSMSSMDDVDDGDEFDIAYRKKGVVEFPDDSVESKIEDLKSTIKEDVKKSLAEEEQISGKLLLGKVVLAYWNDSDLNRTGYFPGVIKAFRIFNNDIQYEVKYDNDIIFWEILDDGITFLDEKFEEVKKKNY